MPNRIMASGSHAVTGTGLRICNVGSNMTRTSATRPMSSPSGMANAAASRKPPYTRDIEASTWVSSVALKASS